MSVTAKCFNIRNTVGLQHSWAKQVKAVYHVSWSLSSCRLVDTGLIWLFQEGLAKARRDAVLSLGLTLSSILQNASLSHRKTAMEVSWGARDFLQSSLGRELEKAEVERAHGSSGAFPRMPVLWASCILRSHPESCLHGNIPKKGLAYPRPSWSGTLNRTYGLRFPSKKSIFLRTKLETQSCPCLESCLINRTQCILDPGHPSEVILPVPLWSCGAYVCHHVRSKDLPLRSGKVGSFLGHFCMWATLLSLLGSRQTGLQIRPHKKIWKTKENYFKSCHGGILAPSLASASRIHLGGTKTPSNPCSELAKASRRG